jgi:hypothetical protein
MEGRNDEGRLDFVYINHLVPIFLVWQTKMLIKSVNKLMPKYIKNNRQIMWKSLLLVFLDRKRISVFFLCKLFLICRIRLTFLFVIRYDNVDVSVAVSTDNGLITPIVFDADKKVSINGRNCIARSWIKACFT